MNRISSFLVSLALVVSVATYTDSAFRNGERANDRESAMQAASRWLSDEEIQALSEYVAGLH